MAFLALQKTPCLFQRIKLQKVCSWYPRLNYATGSQNTIIRSINLKTLTNNRLHKGILSCKHQHYGSLNSMQYYSNHANSKTFENEQFHLIYRFPYIVHTQFLSRLKLYQTVFTVAAIPWAFKMAGDGLITPQMLTGVIGCSILACVMLGVLSIYFQRLIGMLYINKTDNIVKVSHMTFWGKRNDIYMNAENIIPLSDLSDNPNDIYVQFKQYDKKDVFYLVLRFGGVQDSEMMRQLLGEIKMK